MALPLINVVPTLPTDERAKILDLLFEPCDQMHTLSVEALQQNQFQSYDELIRFVGNQFEELYQSDLESDRRWLDAILAAHPRLGEKKVDSEQSRAEQAQLNQGNEEEAEQLVLLNQAYEQTFPGLRYVVFVNGRSRSVIMEDMRRRLERTDIDQERQDAMKAMCDIARDRSNKLGG